MRNQSLDSPSHHGRRTEKPRATPSAGAVLRRWSIGTVRLLHGTHVVVWPMWDQDADTLERAHERPNDQSPRRREFPTAEELDGSDVRRPASVDGDHHGAVVGVDPVDCARHLRALGRRHMAEMAAKVAEPLRRALEQVGATAYATGDELECPLAVGPLSVAVA